MPLQYNEFYHKNTGLTVGVNKLLFSKQSEYQLVEVYETDTWGNLLTIDGMVMLSERDEFVYHEMLAHVAMFAHPNPQRVLIIGGGDGGTAREVLKHPSVTHVDMVEIDRTVVDASKEFFPSVGAFGNPRLNVLYEDGIRFVQDVKESYDIIIVDGSDPVGPAEGLFSNNFYLSCKHALTKNGILTTQTVTPWVKEYHPAMRGVFGALSDLFPISAMYLSAIPLYPAGLWSMGYASLSEDPLSDDIQSRHQAMEKEILRDLKYYNPEVHRAAFALPNFVKDIIK